MQFKFLGKGPEQSRTKATELHLPYSINAPLLTRIYPERSCAVAAAVPTAYCRGGVNSLLLSRRHQRLLHGAYFRNLEIRGLEECHGSVPALAPGTDPGRGLARMSDAKPRNRLELESGASSLSTYSCK